MKTMIGATMSVAVIKFVEQEGTNLPAKAHDHGEEASLQVLGSCSIFEVRPDTPDVERTLAQGDAMIIPAGLSHYGKNCYGAQGVSMQRNKLMFDSARAITEAMHSPVRHAMRQDFERFPPFEGSNIHHPMAARTTFFD